MRGIGIATALFVASFLLHIVGGATDQGWLFAIAVVLIFVTAAAFPAIALLTAGRAAGDRDRAVLLAVGGAAGVALTIATLWAANDRSFAWWEFVVAPALVVAGSGLVLAVRRR